MDLYLSLIKLGCWGGKVVIPEGTERPQTDIELEKMDYLVEGVVGKIPS